MTVECVCVVARLEMEVWELALTNYMLNLMVSSNAESCNVTRRMKLCKAFASLKHHRSQTKLDTVKQGKTWPMVS